jgi:hypothetical protein
MPTLSTQAILNVMNKTDAVSHEFPIDANALTTEYTLAELIGAEHVSLQETDIVVVLSGRSGFSGAYADAGDKFVLCNTEYDATDTERRMAYGIDIARKCAQKHWENGVSKTVYIYFNGLKTQVGLHYLAMC